VSRRLFSLTPAILLLLLFVASVVIWPLHWHRASSIEYFTREHTLIVSLNPDGLYCGVGRGYLDPTPAFGWDPDVKSQSHGWHVSSVAAERFTKPDTTMRFPGFSAGAFDAYTDTPDRTRMRYAEIAYPWLILIFAPPPILWFWRFNRRRKLIGCCAVCTYDLTGNTSGVCPECGTPVARNVGAAA
jgi:hypothetical protein